MNDIFSDALLVEDESNLARALSIALKKLGIRARHVSNVQQAREAFAGAEIPELVVLDRRLPDGDGTEFCVELRASGYQGSILMLTAAGETEDRVQGLNAGADDYLPKPFSWNELEARIRALARRKAYLSPPQASLAQPDPQLWTMDEQRLRIRALKDWVELTPLEFKLAAHLIRAKGAIISREELLKEVWGFSLLPKTRTVDHFLGRLRKLFEQDPENPKHFLTIRGAGYRFRN